MNIVEYSKGVKTHKETEIIGSLQIIQVGLKDLNDNLNRLRIDEINLIPYSEQWVVTKSIMKTIYKSGVVPNSYTIIDVIQYGLESGLKVVEELIARVKAYRAKVWDGSVITARQANILNTIEHLNFWNDYSYMLLDVLITQYSQNKDAEHYLNKADTRWINGTREFYTDFSIELCRGSKEVMRRIDATVELEVDETAMDVIESTKGRPSVAAMKGFGIHLVTPMFWIGVIKEKIDLFRIDNMRRNNEMFAMKIEQAVNKKNGADDAKLDRQIEIYQNAIIKNRDAIETIEGNYA